MRNSSEIKRKAKCKKIVVRAGNGSVYNLGSPTSILFLVRVFIYKLKRKING